MSLDKIQKLVQSLTKSVEDNEKIATPILAAKLAKYAEAYPHDQTIGAMSVVIDKMASNNTLFIRKAELKNLYNKLYSRNTKFAEIFENEMGSVKEVEPVASIKHDDGVNLNPYEVADPILANALNSVFDKDIPVKMYSQSLANKAKLSVASTLDSWNLKPLSIDVNEGNDKFLVIKADYETPKGVTSFYVPVEVASNKVSEASVFMGNTGPQELNYLNIKSYLTTHAGDKLKVNGTGILQVLTSAASENREISDTEMALTRLNASRQGKSEFFTNQIVGQKLSEASVKDVELPKYDDFASFEEKFTSPQGLAEFHLGSAVVNAARENVARELRSFGYQNPQVVIQGFDNSTIFLNVALNAGRIGFAVPVKVSDKKICKPSVLLCNGSVDSFSLEAIERLAKNNSSDFKAAAVASPSYGLKPSDLVNQIRDAVADGNHAKAEDALNVLANSGDEKAYAAGFQVLFQGLNSENTTVAHNEQCSMIIKNSTSEHPICGHTGLPTHKVFQDKDGNCQPLYRKGMAETYEGASFLNAKIFG